MVNAGRDSNIRRETYKCAPIGSDPPDPLPSPVLNVAQGGLPGFKQENPPDFIGGWTRLRVAGFTRGNPDWDGVICISGENLTHWLHISADEVVSSMSFLTLRLRICSRDPTIRTLTRFPKLSAGRNVWRPIFALRRQTKIIGRSQVISWEPNSRPQEHTGWAGRLPCWEMADIPPPWPLRAFPLRATIRNCAKPEVLPPWPNCSDIETAGISRNCPSSR